MPHINNRTPDSAPLSAYRAGDMPVRDLLVERSEGLVFSVPRRMGLSAGDTKEQRPKQFRKLVSDRAGVLDRSRRLRGSRCGGADG